MTRLKTRKLFSNIFYALSANLLSLITSGIIAIVIPKYFGVEDFGYWQLYLFYSMYLGFFHLGLIDGIYLKYGGLSFNSIKRHELIPQIYFLIAIQLLFGSILMLYSFNIADSARKIVWTFLAINLIINNFITLLQYLLQATNKIKIYSISVLLSRITFIVMFFSILLFETKNFESIIIIDLISKIMCLFYLMWKCRRLLVINLKELKFNYSNIFYNTYSGFQLMIGNICGLLILGIVRWGIDYNWDIRTFGEIAFLLNIVNLVITFMSALSIVIFPIIKRVNELELPQIYSQLRNLISFLLLLLLIIIEPLNQLVNIWLPNYSSILIFLPIILPIIFFEGKMYLLTQTFYKIIRAEKMLMRINIFVLVISIISSYIVIFMLSNLTASVLLITILLGLRSYILELYLMHNMKIQKKHILLQELFIVFSYMIAYFFLPTIIFILFYSLLIILYFFKNKIFKEWLTFFNKLYFRGERKDERNYSSRR